jgi:dihydrofolate reductase
MDIGKVSIIVAASTNGVIGKDGDLPWNLPTDLKYFKEVTTGSPVIMGRKCWESIPERFRPLPNRENVIITRNIDYKSYCDAHVRWNLELAVEEHIWGNEEVFIIGGAQIYKEAFKFADKLYLTQIYGNVEGDTFLEGLDPSDWGLVSAEKMMEENGVNFRFEVYERKTEKILG